MDELADVMRRLPASGTYIGQTWGFSRKGGIYPVVTDTVRLDVDGSFPLMIASGTYDPGFGLLSVALPEPVDWVATGLVETTDGVWEGPISWRFPEGLSAWDSALPHRRVRLEVKGQFHAVTPARMTITFTGDFPDVTRELAFVSPYFRTAEFEYDTVEGAGRVTSIDTWAHSHHPASLPKEQLSITTVYNRAGVDIQRSSGTDIVDVDLAMGNANDAWNAQELHDAMRVYWSRYRPVRAQWAIWMLFAHRYEDAANQQTFGIMFDALKLVPGSHVERQGAAVFGHTIDNNVPAGDPQPDAWLRRERFFAAVHEIGHCFNLVHSWEKGYGGGWISMGGSRNELSFMNYPHEVSNFYGGFRFQFDRGELMFLRHAPEDFIKMGGTAYGENHGFIMDRASVAGSSTPDFQLSLACGRERQVFEFLEPVTLDVQLTNTSREPQIVDSSILDDAHTLTLVIQSRDGIARQWRPYVRRCTLGEQRVLQPGESLRTSVFASAGLDGWYLAEPGSYTIHGMLSGLAGTIATTPLTLRIAAPRSWDEDLLAQDLFTDEVGRTLAMGGTLVMTDALTALHEVVDRLPDRAVTRHARLALGLPLMRNRKVLQLPDGSVPMASAACDGGILGVADARPEEARRCLHEALIEGDGVPAAETFAPHAHHRYVMQFADWLASSGDEAAAEEARAMLPRGNAADA